MYRKFRAAFAACLLGLVSVSATASPAFTTSLLSTQVQAPLIAHVDISDQLMTVIQNGRVTYRWPVSTARTGKYTPRGTWNGQWLSRHHKSSLYDDAPMPYAIFFNGNYAIHGTTQISRLGRPASAGCVRLHPDHAAVLFQLTRAVGKENLQVMIRD